MNRHRNQTAHQTQSRVRSRAVPMTLRTWWPEICGGLLLLIAALETAKLIA